jgi:hypothetical protein
MPTLNQGMMNFGKAGAGAIDDVENLCRRYGNPIWPDGPERMRDAFIHVIERQSETPE